MLVLILILIVGSIFVYISKYNFMPVSINFGFHSYSDIPLFYVIIGSIAVGLILAYILYIVHSIFNSLTLMSKDKEIKQNKDEILELTKRVHQLELEKEKLKYTCETDTEPEDPNAL